VQRFFSHHTLEIFNSQLVLRSSALTAQRFLDVSHTWFNIKPFYILPTQHIDLYLTYDCHWLIGKHFPLLLENKLLIYKTLLKPVWTYGIELWGCATKSNIAVNLRYQSKLLRTMTNAPRYVSNQTLYSDLHIPHVRTVYREGTATHHTTLDSHPNSLMEPLVHPPNRRLKRRWTFDEIH
jgi:hypothetical protein